MLKSSIFVVFTLLIILICGSSCVVGSKMIFFRNSNAQSETTTPVNDKEIHGATIINAPTKCPKGFKPDKRGICRKFI